MIFDHLSNASKYFSLNKYFEDAFNFLMHTNLKDLNEGKHFIKDEECFAIVNKYNTKKESESFAESHKKYIDIQFMVSGLEKLGFGFINEFHNEIYNESNDLQKHSGEMNFVDLKENYFAILFPHDVHMPGIIKNEIQAVLKVVIKVAI